MPSRHPFAFTGEVPTNAPVNFNLGALTVPVTIASTASLTLLQTGFTLQPADAIPGAMYHIHGWGNYGVTGTPTMTFASYLGGITGTALAAVPAVTAGSGVTNCLFYYDVYLSFTTATTVESAIVLNLGTSSSTDAASLFVAAPLTATTVAVAATGSAHVMGFTWSASSASNTITLRGGNVERLA